jgi:hypothetical protein
MLLTWLAQAHAALAQSAEEQRPLVEAAQVVELTEERVSEAELLHRVPGDLLKASDNRTGAERSYHQAITIANQQSAKVLELRAATNLARLWHEHGADREAQAFLTPVYNWFTERVDAPVLQEAKKVLEQLK